VLHGAVVIHINNLIEVANVFSSGYKLHQSGMEFQCLVCSFNLFPTNMKNLAPKILGLCSTITG